MTLPLTIVIPVKNEALNLPRCLASLPADVRVLVVDSGSTDDTVRIATEAGAEVIQFDWSGGFPKKRNWVLQNHAFAAPWVLFLDADERLTPAFMRELEPAVSRSDRVAYWLYYRIHFMGRALRYGVAQRKLALFRVGAGLFERIEEERWSNLDMEVHEHPILIGAIGEIAATIEHDDARGLHRFLARNNDYSTWEARRFQGLADNPTAWSDLTRRQRLKYRNLDRWWFAPLYFLYAYVVRGGLLDGRAGFVHAFMRFTYFFEIRLKIIELKKLASAPVPRRNGRRPPTIFFVNRFFHPDQSATSQLLSDLAFEIAADRRVVVITSRLRFDAPEARLPGREIVRGVEVRRVATSGFGRASVIGRAADLATFHLTAGLALLARARRGDLVVAKTDPPLISVIAGMAARVKGARHLNWLQDVYPEVATALGMRNLGGSVGRGLRWMRDVSLKNANDNIVVGEHMAKHLRAAGVPSERIRIIPNWTDEEAIAPIDHGRNPLRGSWGLEHKFVVGYSGNLGRAHEFETMLGAAALLAEDTSIVFLMIGDGHYAADLRDAAEGAHLANIQFRPYQDRADLGLSLGVADVHWISLRPELEGLIVPSKVYGVLAAGRPILAVTGPDGEIARLVAEHGCGIQCDPGNAHAFAGAIRRLAAEPALVARMGAAARVAATGAYSRGFALAKWRGALGAEGPRARRSGEIFNA